MVQHKSSLPLPPGVGHRAQKSLTYGSATKNITTVFRLLGIKMKCYQNTSKLPSMTHLSINGTIRI